jgi:hypothetical protein
LVSDPEDGDLSSDTYLPCGYHQGGAGQGDAIRIFDLVRSVRGVGGDPVAIFVDRFEDSGTSMWSFD